MLRYKLNPQWELRGYVEYDKLPGSAADSPLVKLRGSTNQMTYGLGVAYSFDVGVRLAPASQGSMTASW